MRTGSPPCGSTGPRRRRSLALLALALAAGAGPRPAVAQTETCVDVQVGSERSYDCINAGLARAARLAPVQPDPGTLTAASPPNAVGSFDRAGTAERLGANFGHSALPQRPPRPVYASPLLSPSR